MPIAETNRAVGRLAAALDLHRPSCEQVRVHVHRRRLRRWSGVTLSVSVALTVAVSRPTSRRAPARGGADSEHGSAGDERAREVLRVERAEIVESFADADELDRQTELVAMATATRPSRSRRAW